MKLIFYFFILYNFALISCKKQNLSYSVAKDKNSEKVKQDINDSISVKDNLSIITFNNSKNIDGDTISIIAVGDIMLGTNYPNSNDLFKNSELLLAKLTPILSNSDITFGNLEGCLLNSGGIPKKCSNPNACFLFRSPEEYAKHIKNAGFDILSLANNHINDFGKLGIKRTMEVLDNNSIYYSGLSNKCPYIYLKKDNIVYGFISFAPNKGCNDINNINLAKQMIHNMDKNCDILIVSFHGGAEGKENLHTKNKDEFYYGENRGNVIEFSHSMIDSGADLVIGHGPHVPRAIELYKNKIIAYSLGNFITHNKVNIKNENGISPILKVKLNKKGELYYGKIISAKQIYKQGVIIDNENRAFKLISYLSQTDFNCKLEFNNNTFTIKN